MTEATLNSTQEANEARPAPVERAGLRGRTQLIRNAILAVPILLFVIGMLAGLGFFFTQTVILGRVALAAGLAGGLISLLVAFTLPGEG